MSAFGLECFTDTSAHTAAHTLAGSSGRRGALARHTHTHRQEARASDPLGALKRTNSVAVSLVLELRTKLTKFINLQGFFDVRLFAVHLHTVSNYRLLRTLFFFCYELIISLQRPSHRANAERPAATKSIEPFCAIFASTFFDYRRISGNLNHIVNYFAPRSDPFRALERKQRVIHRGECNRERIIIRRFICGSN